MGKKCTNPNCFVHEGESCILGHMDTADCTHYCENVPEEKDVKTTTPSDASARVPWSGSTLGLADLITLLPRSRSILVGVLGAHDAGKTTLLMGNYFGCLSGKRIAEAEFAGSWTLGAWESLAAWSRFDDAACAPHFPPHTSRGVSRSPGLLHLALRRKGESTRDVLLTDAPGEWFTNWAINENAYDAEGARWTVEHSNVFLVFADCERLRGKDRGRARNDLRMLIERLGPYVDGRPVVMVWAKSDKSPVKELANGIRNSIQQALKVNIPHSIEISTTVEDPDSLNKALSTALNKSWQPNRARPIIDPVLNHQPYSAFRGYHANT